MNRKVAILVAVVLFASFVGGAFADTLSNSPTHTSLLTSGVDIDLSTSSTVIDQFPTITSNLTMGFAFAPPASFVQTQSVLVSLLYIRGSTYTPDSIFIQLNSGTPSVIPYSPAANYGSPVTGAVGISKASLHVGSNVLTMALNSGCGGSSGCIVGVSFARLIVEYTYMG